MNIKLEQKKTLPTKQNIDAVTNWIMVFANPIQEKVLPYSEKLLQRRKQLSQQGKQSELEKADDAPVVVDLPNESSSHVAYAAIEATINSFDLLTLARKMVAAHTEANPGQIGLVVSGFDDEQSERIAEAQIYSLGDYALNQAGVAAAVASYADEHFLTFSKSNIVEAREMITSGLTENGLSALPSATNFMYVDLGKRNAETFRQAMQEQGVLIKGIYRDYTNWSRVSMGLLEDVAKYVKALPPVLDKVGIS